MLKGAGILAILLASWLAATPAQAATASLENARSLMDQGREREAVSMLQQVVRGSDGEYQAWFLLGVAYARQRQYHEAIEAFRKVSSLRPDLAEPHNNLAVIYNELGDLRAAVNELEISLAKNPDYATAQENIGDLYVKLALQAYQKSLVQAPNDALQARYDRLLQVRMGTPSAKVDAGEGQAMTGKKAMTSGEEQGAVSRRQSQSSPADAASEPAAESVAAPPKIAPVSSATEVHTATGGADEPMQEKQQAADPAAKVLAAVELWRRAWSARDVEAYLAAYAPEFGPGGSFASRSDWEHYKHRVISGKKYIKVTLDDVQVSLPDGGTAKVHFVQHFRSNNYNSDDRKELTLRQAEDGWKITHEKSL